METRQSLLARMLLFYLRESESLKEMRIDGILENMKKTIALILFAALALSILSAGSVYLDSGISIAKGDRAIVFQDIEKASPRASLANRRIPLWKGGNADCKVKCNYPVCKS